MDKFSEGAKASLANCFVPEMLVDYIRKNVRHGKEKLEPASFFLEGVCLLVDISGFTMMSEKFCNDGKGGIDSLQLATNGYMGKLVEVIYAYGGDIMKFAGDALICVFSSDFTIDTTSKGKVRRENSSPNVSVEVILRAMHCAHVIRAVQTDSLSVHVAMSCGEMCFGILGGVENRWECLISGPCIRQLSDCLDDAPSKEAAMSPECAAILNSHLTRPATVREVNGQNVEQCVVEADSGVFSFDLMTLPSGNRKIVRVSHEQCLSNRKTSDNQNVAKLTSSRQKAVIDKLVRQFVPAPIADELETATGLSYFSEIREVVTMFMKWDSYDADGKHRDLLELQACFYQAQRILHSTGAYLRQFLVDDKGCVLIGCWGMPNMSYMDNAFRAQSAAAQIRQELDRLGMETSVGITTGDVYCGTVGSERRMEYAAIGSSVNMAARLMGKAKGRLLIGDATYARMPKSAHEALEAIEPMMVKGKATPLQAYQYIPTVTTKAPTEVDNSEIPTGCRQVLGNLLQELTKELRCDSTVATATAGAGAMGELSLDHSPKSVSTTIKPGKSGKSGKSDVSSFHSITRPSSLFPSRQSSALSSVRSGHGSNRSRPGSIQFAGNLTNLLWFGRSTSAAFSTKDQRPVVLLNGKEGSGRTTVVVWLKAQAADMKIPVIGAKLTKKESQIDFHVWKRLFQQLMPRDMFQNNATQRSYSLLLLKKVYAATPQLAETVGFPALKLALGVSCGFDESESAESSPKKPGLKKGSSVFGLMAAKSKPRLDSLPSVPLQDTLLKIFTHLLNERSTLVILENIELADEESLKLLTELISASTRSSFVLTALLLDDKVKRTRIGKYLLPKTYEADAFNHTPWTKQYRSVIQDLRCTTTVVLEKYTLQDIEKMLAAALGGRAVKADMARQVQEFSGGSCFWVREIIQSIRDNGIEQFMSAIGAVEEDTGPDTFGGANALGSVSFEASFRVRRSSVANNGQVPKAATTRITGNRTSVKGQLSRAASSNHIDTTFSQMKLDKLVLCRFNNLAADVQRILRTASVIGATFSGGILYGVLSRHLKEQMSASVDILLAQKWIYQDTESETMYHFAHPHSHKIIYQLTPSSERNNLHQIIAEYIEETYGDDKAQYASLSYHYQHCDTDKALQYCVQATTVLLDTDVIFDFGDCLDLLFGTYPCCKSSYDIDVLIKLTSQVRTALEELRVGSDSAKSQQGWLTSFFTLPKVILRGLGTVSGTSSAAASSRGSTHSGSSSSGNSSNKVAPAPLPGMYSNKGASFMGVSGKIYETATDDGESDLGCDGEVDYELRTKRMFLSQLDRLNDQLCQKHTTLSDSIIEASAAAMAAAAEGYAAEWAAE